MENILVVNNLVKHYFLPRSTTKVHSVDNISFSIKKGETFGLAGESGCGKTTTGRLITGLVSPTSGTIHFLSKSISNLNNEETKEFRRNIQMIFQDPFGSLNPRKTIGSILSLPFKIYESAEKSNIKNKVMNLLESVDLKPPNIFWDRYPHELSGGQRQRISIARSIAIHPQLIVADEAVAALDISVKSGILNLMRYLREKSGIGYLFISHDLSVLRNMCDRIAIMYLGKFVEVANAEDIFINCQHPYTRALLSAALVPNPRIEHSKKRMILNGDVASAINLPVGCRFNTRCPNANAKCHEVEPELSPFKSEHMVACHLVH
jgi:peptide/nickel transport system ATP-binding protein